MTRKSGKLIKEEYTDAIRSGLSHQDAIKAIAVSHGCGELRIRNVVFNSGVAVVADDRPWNPWSGYTSGEGRWTFDQWAKGLKVFATVLILLAIVPVIRGFSEKTVLAENSNRTEKSKTSREEDEAIKAIVNNCSDGWRDRYASYEDCKNNKGLLNP